MNHIRTSLDDSHLPEVSETIQDHTEKTSVSTQEILDTLSQMEETASRTTIPLLETARTKILQLEQN